MVTVSGCPIDATKDEDRIPVAAREADLFGTSCLSDEQAGHLRHFRNLANQDDGDWTDMQRGGGGLGADYKFQIAIMCYAMALAYYHHLPAAPAVFRKSFENLIRKMMLLDVWQDWIWISPSGPLFDSAFEKPRDYNWNPVSSENIMYSGHLNAMVAIYSWFFQDDKFDKVGSISLVSPLAKYARLQGDATLGLVGTTTIDPEWTRNYFAEYSLQTLNDTIYWQLAENGFMGVACEPNQIFVVCNQFPMLGFRFQDLRKGTTVADDLTLAYRAAWERRGLLMPGGDELHRQWRKSGDGIYGPSSAWTYAFLNATQRDVVQQTYPFVRRSLGRLNDDGTFVAYAVPQWPEIRGLADAGAPLPMPKPDRDGFATGSAALLLSEMGDPVLGEFYRYVDNHMSPTWKNGGLFYPRNSQPTDADGNLTVMGSGVGNAFLAYGRLNLKDGLYRLYQEPWDKSFFEQPCITEVSDVDVVRARFVPEAEALIVSVRAPRGLKRDSVSMVIANMARGDWVLTLDGKEVGRGSSGAVHSSSLPMLELHDGSLHLSAALEGKMDVIVTWR